MVTAREEAIRRVLSEVVDGGDYSVLPTLVTENYIDHTPMGDVVGHEGFGGFLDQFRQAMPGFRHDVSDVKEMGGGYLVFQVHFTGSFTGSFMGTNGDGRTIELYVANGARFEGGKLAEHWGLGPDSGAEIMSQMGINLTPA